MIFNGRGAERQSTHNPGVSRLLFLMLENWKGDILGVNEERAAHFEQTLRITALLTHKC